MAGKIDLRVGKHNSLLVKTLSNENIYIRQFGKKMAEGRHVNDFSPILAWPTRSKETSVIKSVNYYGRLGLRKD